MEQIDKFKSDLDAIIRARYPIIWIETHEESRFMNILNDINKTGKTISYWSITSGLCNPAGNLIAQNLNDPMAILDHITKSITESQDKEIIVLKDFHRFMDDILITRKLRDLHHTLKQSYKTIIITAPSTSIPYELQKAITILSLPLPNKQELDIVLYNMINSVGDIELSAQLQNQYHTTKESLMCAGLGLTEAEYENVIARSIAQTQTLESATIIQEKEQIIKKSGILEFINTDLTIDDIGGLENLKPWILQRKQAFTPSARKYGLPVPKGIVLTGPPGTGKSLTAKAIASLMNMPLLKFEAGKIFGRYVGDSEKNIDTMLSTAAAVAPCILMIDEVEKIFGSSGDSNESGVTTRVFGKILSWQQDMTEPVFTVVTCNDPLKLPPEFMRTGRFDEIFYIGLPNTKERKAIFKIHINKLNRNADNYTLQSFATHTPGYSGAEIQGIVQNALYAAYFEHREPTNQDILTAIKNKIPLSKQRAEDLKAIQEWGKINAVNASITEEESTTTTKGSRRIEVT